MDFELHLPWLPWLPSWLPWLPALVISVICHPRCTRDATNDGREPVSKNDKCTNEEIHKYTNSKITHNEHNKCTIGKRQIINVEVKSAQLHKWQMIGLVRAWKWSKGLLSQVSPGYWCSFRNKRKDGGKNWCWLGNKQKTMNQLFLFGCATNKIHDEKSWVWLQFVMLLSNTMHAPCTCLIVLWIVLMQYLANQFDNSMMPSVYKLQRCEVC